MSSNIRIKKICEYCGNEFEARKTTSKTCSNNCAKMLYKAKQRNAKLQKAINETVAIKAKPFEDIKVKEFLSVRDVAKLLNSSRQTVYNLINSGVIKAVNIKIKKTIIKRSEIDKLFEQSDLKPEKVLPTNEPLAVNKTDYYTLAEIQSLYGISQKTLYNLIKRNNIPTLRNGKITVVSKNRIKEILGEPKQILTNNE